MLANACLVICLLLQCGHQVSAANSQRHGRVRRDTIPGFKYGPDLPAPQASDISPQAQLRNGTYYGLHSDPYDQDFFISVPYAQPPVGQLRYNVPRSLNDSWTGTRNATTFGPSCYGYGDDTFVGGGNRVSEDCLTLNIIRPSGCAEDEKLPVLVWFHGGGFYEGTSVDARYNMSFIVQQSQLIDKPIMAISVNYRLTWFGYLYSREVVDAGVANLGLRDQRKALEWLQENIGAFGGDKEKITIWGESAGAASVGNHLLAYNGRDDNLFRGAIADSGATTGFGMGNPTIQIAEEVWANVTRVTGCSNSTDKLQCLREQPVEVLNDIFNGTLSEGYYSLHVGPIVDGDILARPGWEQMKDGHFVEVPYILGESADDGTDFIPFGLNTDADVRAYFAVWGFTNETLDEIFTLYPNEPLQEIPLSAPYSFNDTIGMQWKRTATIWGDIVFKSVRRLCSRLWARHTDVPLYSYRFNAIPAGVPDYYGATHWQEMPFVLHNTLGVGFPSLASDPVYYGKPPFEGKPQSYYELADLISRMWISFVHDGEPNFDNQNATEWPIWTLDEPRAYVFDANVSSYVEDDTYRKDGIGYFMKQYATSAYPWYLHDTA